MSIDLETRLDRFPKVRPTLPPRLQEIYARQYLENRAGDSAAASFSQRLERWMHWQVARDAAPNKTTLELGAGNLNQLPFEARGGDYDIVEPFETLYSGSPSLARVRAIYGDIAEIPAGARYARITSIAALEHICDLPMVLARATQLLEPGGVFRAAIPSEGGVLWKLGWLLTTGLEFRLRHGLDYSLLIAHEHVNDAAEIEALVNVMFGEVQVKSFGLGRQLSLYRFIEAREPRLGLAKVWSRRFAS